ncbi:MAG: hypothetical protein HC811_03810 [Flammeovirgaceae bacterium]|nr:hypothetical protein [Flammeovirgaceae bacterium]
MRKAFAIVLSFTLLLASLFEMENLTRFPYLIHHFLEHKEKTSEFSAFEFFTLHYGDQEASHDQEEHEEHEDLPFKPHDCTSSQIAFLNAPLLESASTQSYSVSYSNFYQSTYSIDFASSVWQPPKMILSPQPF